MSDDPKDFTSYWGLLPAKGLRWVLKHKPVFVKGEKGDCHIKIHPEDARLLTDDCDIAEPQEGRR